MSARFTTLSLVILAVLCALNISSAATIRDISQLVAKEPTTIFEARQAYSDEEGSNEDSVEGDDDEAVQQAYIQAQQNRESSVEDSDEEGDDDQEDDDDYRRRRRELMSTAEKLPVEVATEVATTATEDSIKKEQEAATPVAAVTAATPATSVPPKKSSVLILIRDTLKKVTNDLPTQQYASNALQYFQLFEHFLQETIEQVISADDDEEDEEASTNKTEIDVAVEEAVIKGPETVQTAEAVEEVANVVHVIEEQKKPMVTSEHVAVTQAVTAAPAVATVKSNPTKIKFV